MRRWITSILGTAFLLVAVAALVRGDSTAIVRVYPLNYSGVQDVNHAGTPTMWIDFSQDPSGATITTSDGGFTLTKVGTPTRVLDYTYPEGIAGTHGYAHQFSGDKWTRASDGAFRPAGSFSVQCAFTTYDGTALDEVIGKWDTAGNQRSWRLYTNVANTCFGLSDDGTVNGGHYSTLCVNPSSTAYRPSFVTASYEFTTDGSCEARLYVDNLATGSSSAFDGPAYASTADFAIGIGWDGLIHNCAYYDGIVLTEEDHDFMFSHWQGRLSTAGNDVAISSAAPPASMMDDGTNIEPFIIDHPADSISIGPYGLCGLEAVDNLAQRSSMETWGAGGSCAAAPTGWADTCTVGDGSAALSQETSIVAHGGSSAKMVLTGTTSVAYIDSVCLTTGIGNDVYVSSWMKKAAGTSSSYITLIEYDTNVCGTYLQSQAIKAAGDVATDWTKYGGLAPAAAWHINTSSYKVRIAESGNGGVTIYADAAQIREASYDTYSQCHADTDATASCNRVIPSTPSPLSANGVNQVEFVGRTPWAGTDISVPSYLFTDGDNTAANSMRLVVAVGSDEASFWVYDNAANSLYNLPNVANWAANTDYTLKMTAFGDGRMGLWWNGTWNTTTGGVGTGIRSAAQATLYPGATHNWASGACVHNFIVKRRYQP